MKKVILKSPLADRIRQYVSTCQNDQGLNFKVDRSVLYAFDNFCVNNGIVEMLSEDAFFKYCDSGDVLLAQKGKRYRILFRFYEYCRVFDPSLKPLRRQLFFGKYTRHVAYIYTSEEIDRLMAYKAWQNENRWITIRWRCMVGILFATGLRISELLGLNLGDVHRDECVLYIAPSKYRKERYVPVAKSVIEAIDKYIAVRPTVDTPRLFVSRRGLGLSFGTFNQMFNRVIRELRIGAGSTTKPRVHDLRHTFAVNRVVEWNRQGVDVGRMLPVLSTYLGHAHVADTAYYLESSSEILGSVIQRANLVMENPR